VTQTKTDPINPASPELHASGEEVVTSRTNSDTALFVPNSMHTEEHPVSFSLAASVQDGSRFFFGRDGRRAGSRMTRPLVDAPRGRP